MWDATSVQPAERMSRPPATWLNRLSLSVSRGGRLKTGTPPRLARKSIDFDDGVNRGVFHVEHGDSEPIPFSFTATEPAREQSAVLPDAYDARVHELVRSKISESPLYNGQIEGIGPRYCPSLEDR
jgi:tRNA uridine 5-carboxymethylaminomethyl modification enzyme